MSDDKRYNGWTNYATWRVNLELFDGHDSESLGLRSGMSEYNAGQALKERAQELADEYPDGWVKDYAMAFMDGVNWQEIAGHYMPEEEDSEEEDSEKEADAS